jgi:hypothetical protein
VAMPCRARHSSQPRIRKVWPMAAQAWRWRRSVGLRANPSRPTPAPMAPELTSTTRRPASRRCASCSARLSSRARSSIPSGPVSTFVPTLMTTVWARAITSCRTGSIIGVPNVPHQGGLRDRTDLRSQGGTGLRPQGGLRDPCDRATPPGCAARPFALEYNACGVKTKRARPALVYPEGVPFHSEGSRSAPWGRSNALGPKAGKRGFALLSF